MTPGDEYVDPLIKRGEELERLLATDDPSLADDIDFGSARHELASIKAIARARLAHTTQFPFASSSAEESAQYLAQQEARSAHEREQAILTAFRKALALLEPIAIAALQGALTRGIAALPVPVELRGVVTAVETAALDAARVVVADVRG